MRLHEAKAKLDKARATYRKTYDRLYVASMQANTKEECDAIDASLALANLALQAAENEAADIFEECA